MRVSFKSLVELNDFQSACNEAGYLAFWDSKIMDVVMEDAVGRYCFRAGTRASRVMEMLMDTTPFKVFEELLVPMMETYGTKKFLEYLFFFSEKLCYIS